MRNPQNPDQSTLTDPALLDKIDKLFACNVGEYISLPQLVVVGDQSSGKSSVLEGLTQLPFPRDSGLCTRFATQIIFRRVKEYSVRKITASVLPGSDASPEKKAALEKWTWGKDGPFDPSEFSHVMGECQGASQATGQAIYRFIDKTQLEELQQDRRRAQIDILYISKSTFSNDIFRLEICGPNEDHLSVIDVPGIFKNTTPGLTSKTDIQLVRDMVLGYMRNPRSIMLTVVPANVDIATQEIIELARELDHDGQRTLGVLTKPDLVDEGAEQKVLDLLRGEDLILKHGWFLVRNLGQRELQEGGVDRNTAEEEFGRKEPWNSISPDRFGINALRLRLQEAVIDNARKSFSQVRLEIMKRLKSRKQALKDLGDERVTPEQQRGHLLSVVARFQEITSHGLSSNYGTDDIFDSHPDLRLATLVMNRHILFAENLTVWAHEYKFKTETDMNNSKGDQVDDSEEDSSTSEDRQTSEDEHLSGSNKLTKSIKTRETANLEDLTEVLHECTEEVSPKDGEIYEWLTEVLCSSRGFEMGTFNPSLLATTMRKQSAKWLNFTLGYISDIITIVHRFILAALEVACVDQRVCRRLKTRLMEDLLSKYQGAIKQANFILNIERNGTPLTLNHYFNDSLQECRATRIQTQLAPKVLGDYQHGEVIRLCDVSAVHHKNNTRQTVEDIHDILQSYYKAALRRFVDNVCMQAADYYLVNGPETPTKLLCSLYVNKLSAADLEDIAGEESHVQRLRVQLTKEITDLEAGKKILL